MIAQLRQFSQPASANVIHSLTWEQFEELDRSLDQVAGVKLAYLDGNAEIMPISPEHEDFKSTLVRLLEAFMDEKEIRYYKRGGPSLGNKALGARNEPDESYNFDAPKSAPDLVIEVVKTSGGINKLEGYRRLEVKEVWFWEDGVLAFHQLQNDGYHKVERSGLLPDLPIEAFCRYITYFDQYEAAKEFKKLIRNG